MSSRPEGSSIRQRRLELPNMQSLRAQAIHSLNFNSKHADREKGSIKVSQFLWWCSPF
ncbi:hypothetical protein AN958_06056 [Leucoagaricus sp. SymC.cos]|nr:hypothetical protein AN958_06056 [Leucoagaricus sp. SymC.cos]